MKATGASASGVCMEMESDLARLVSLIEQSRVEEARELAPVLASRWPDSEPLQRLNRALEPPRTLGVSAAKGRSRKQEFAWLRQHGREYPGCWLALLGDRLVAVGPDRKTVDEMVHQAVGDERVLMFFQPATK